MSADITFCISIPIGAWAPGLPAALRSLKAQTAKMQIALCDASGDPRVAAAADESGIEFAHRRHGPDGGQSDAIIEGWAHTEGEILAWLNADDVLAPGALERAATAFQADPELDVFYGESTILDDEGATIGVHPAVSPPSDTLLRSCNISQPSCFFRREATERAGGLDASRHYTMDWDLWVRLLVQGSKFAHTRAVLSGVLFERGTKTSSMPAERLAEIYSIVKPNAGRFAAFKSALGFCLHHLGAYTALARPLKRLRRGGLAPERAAGTTGLTGAGVIAGRGRLPVINLGDAPKTRLRVDLAGPGAEETEIAVGGQTASGPRADFILDEPVAPAQAIELILRTEKKNGPASFRRAVFL